MNWSAAFAQFPFVAILRGITPDDILPTFEALYAKGFRCIEVPLNSPDAFESIRRLCALNQDDCWIGAGTILDTESLSRLIDTGARLAVMPHCDAELITKAVQAKLICMPGVMTPTEAFRALQAGAHALKLFPAEIARPEGLRALRAVLPKECCVLPVGGVQAEHLHSWWQAGARGFGLGSALYQAGQSPAETGRRAHLFAEAWRALQESR